MSDGRDNTLMRMVLTSSMIMYKFLASWKVAPNLTINLLDTNRSLVGFCSKSSAARLKYGIRCKRCHILTGG